MLTFPSINGAKIASTSKTVGKQGRSDAFVCSLILDPFHTFV